MKGIPKRIATAYDVALLQGYIGSEHDTPESRAYILAQLRAIRATATHYVFTRTLASESDRAGPEPEYRVMTGQGEAQDEIHEFQLQDNPGSRLVRLGMTAAQMDALIAEVDHG